jgi:uncharacterized protein (DUF1684 family)
MKLITVLACAVTLSAQTAYEREITQWRAEREASLKVDNGWLTVVGLHELSEGENRVGSDPNFEVPLPASAPQRVGTITLSKRKLHFKPAPGIPLKEMNLKTDLLPDYDKLSLGRLTFFVIERGNMFGVRVQDNDSAARKNFSGLRWYSIDPSWKIKAKFVPSPHPVTFNTVVGVKEKDQSPGYVTFTRGGQTYRLEPTKDGDELFFVIRDQTSGKTTYGASRFLYTELPKDGFVELDFNRAENPPCAFTDYATCPLPPPQNRMKLAVTAGEMMYGQHH